MERFAELLDRLVFTSSRNAKLRLMGDYFRTVGDPDRGHALAAFLKVVERAGVRAAPGGQGRGRGGRVRRPTVEPADAPGFGGVIAAALGVGGHGNVQPLRLQVGRLRRAAVARVFPRAPLVVTGPVGNHQDDVLRGRLRRSQQDGSNKCE